MKRITGGAGMLSMILVLLFSSRLNAQDESSIADQIEARHFIFKAQTAMPTGGSARQLTSDYDIKVTEGKLDVYLPYFGRAYVAPIDPTSGGLQFSSSDFSYVSLPRKKGGWNISIKPHDAKDVRELSLSISQKGYASVQVISNNRQPISFDGYVADKAK